MADKVILLFMTSSSIVIFLFGQRCFINRRKEAFLISKLNSLEKKLLTSEKESSSNTGLLSETRQKMNSIVDKSFGTDDIIKQYEMDKKQLLEKISSLENELETATEAGLELNKMVSDLLNNQAGSDSIMTSVEELQQQLNEQEANTIYINNLLADKSRENNELHVLLSKTNEKFASEISNLIAINHKLELDKEVIESDIKNIVKSLEDKFNEEIETKAKENIQLDAENKELKMQNGELYSKLQSTSVRIEALQNITKKLNHIGKDELDLIAEITEANVKYSTIKKENDLLSQKLYDESNCKDLLQNHVLELSSEITRIQTVFNSSEKERLEAKTKLEVLSNYFKEKETQLQRYFKRN